jgi:hypothetical protein
MRFAQIALNALMASIAVGAAPTAAPIFPEGVGSNMVFQELGEYAARPTGENWERDVKVTLLHYHEKPDEVRARLKAMRASGQTKIGLMLWYIQEGDKRDSFSHVICPHDGRLPAQIESNIRNILKDISAAGFDTVVMRLAAQGQADPMDAAYQPARAADSWKLFENLFAARRRERSSRFFTTWARRRWGIRTPSDPAHRRF